MPSATTVNIGILAHVDAGKTSLTERLLYDTGVLARLGRVDAGTTRTDSAAVERRRGITVRAAVAALPVPYGQVNLIDTPGHSEFVAEVERALDVLDGAILVISAVEGVQPQTRVLMRTLRRLRLPTLIFVNKIDRPGARYGGLLADIRRRLTPDVVAMTGADATPYAPDDPEFTTRLSETLADHDDALLARLVDGPAPGPADLASALTSQTAAGRVHPVYFGSAITGAGVPALLTAVTRLFPGAAPARAGEPSGVFFAVRRGDGGEKVAYLRLFSGELARRARVGFWRYGADGGVVEGRGRVTDLRVVAADPGRSAGVLRPGDIAEVRGLADVRAGDRIGPGRAAAGGFAAPGLETVVRARRAADAARLHAAVRVLADCDPLVVPAGNADGGVRLRLYGEVQKEIVAATLAEEFGVAVTFAPSRAVYLERPARTGEAAEEIGEREPVPFWATVGLRVRPGAYGSGVRFTRDTELGALPRAFDRAIEATVREVLGQGLYGWPVTDCTVTLTRSGYASPVSTAGDFRGLTPLVLMRALAAAGTRVYEPVHAFEAEVPAETVGAVAARLAALSGVLDACAALPGDAETWVLRGTLPARHVHTVQGELPGLARGDGAWWSRAEGDRVVPGTPPRRPRAGADPLNRAAYLRERS